MSTAPSLRTARLELRPLALADLDANHALWIDPVVRRFLFDDQIIPRAQAEAEIHASERRFASADLGLFALRLLGEPELIGFAGYCDFDDPPAPELLYGVAPVHQGKGLASEAAHALIARAFACGWPEVVASADAPNTASIRVMQKAGMELLRRGPGVLFERVYYRVRSERRDTNGSQRGT